MSDLVQFLQDRLDEEERAAREACDRASGHWFVGEEWNVYQAEDISPQEDFETNELVVYGNMKSQSKHIARHDPKRVLVEVEAKRRRLQRHQPEITEYYDRHGEIASFTACGICGNAGGIDDAWPCDDLKDDAAPYADEPGYDESWRL